jgi:hypothetical protein
VPGAEQSLLNDDPAIATRVSAERSALFVEVIATPMPSELRVGVYPGRLDQIDPSVPPPAEFDCLEGTRCQFQFSGSRGRADLSSLWPGKSTNAVFVVYAAYLAVDDEQIPFAHSIAWVFEIEDRP